METEGKDRIDEALEIMRGIKDICIVFEENREKDLPKTAYIVLEAALDRAIKSLEGSQDR